MTDSQKKVVQNELILLNIEDIIDITEWSAATVRKMFVNDKEFPAIKKGKKYQVEYSAFKNYLSKRRINKKEE